MRFPLRWRILSFTVLPIVTLAFAALWMVNHTITRQVDRAVHDDLGRAAAVLEDLLAASEQSLGVATQVIAHDPRFFSVLTLPGAHTDPEVRATVAGVALDFNAITRADLFEVTDDAGHLLATVARDATEQRERGGLVRAALAGQPLSRVLVHGEALHLVSASPVRAGGQIVGVLIVGTRIGDELAARLRGLTRSEVTFLSGDGVAGSTLVSVDDRAAVAAAARLGAGARPGRRADGFTRVRGAEHDYLTLVRPLPHSAAGTGPSFVIQRALDVEMAALRDIQTGLVELGVAALVVALLAGFTVAERIAAPVRRLVRGAEEMERGNYEFPLEVRGRDEIGALATSFHEMRRRQRQYVHSLEEVARIKTEFINVASHELRTPLSVVRGFQELMANGTLGELTPSQRQAVEASLRAVATLTRIAEDATRVAQIEHDRLSLNRAEYDVATLARAALATAGGLARGRAVRLAAAVAPGTGSAWVDEGRLTQALVHLVTNGIRFTPDGGRVELRARREGAELVLEVADTGVGIEPGRLAHIFDRGFIMRDSLNHHSSSTLEFESAGLGLGLSVARGVAEAHGGTLTVRSTPGAGSTFTLRVPAEPADALARAA